GVRRLVQPKTAGQAQYLREILEHDIVIGVGPAGTGKTYLAVAAAVDFLHKKRVRKIVLARPAELEGLVGDIYVCPAVAAAHAARFGCGVREETARLVVHGTLHVLGHDHPVGPTREASPMWRRQERLLRRLWPPSPAR
ncbi:MAG: rRNA maturation RNase YbeY, partial [Gemmatimonadota bacterium]